MEPASAWPAVSGGEIENELARDWLDHFAFVAEGDAAAGAKRAGLEQWILHACCLLLHSLKRLPDHRRPNFMSAEVAHLLDLQEIKKGIAFHGGDQSGFFPTCQLTRREPKYPEQICSTVSVHDNRKRSGSLSGSWGCFGKWK